MNIGNTIKTFRDKLGITQVILSELTGLSQTFLSEVESNKKEPSAKSLDKIGKALGLSAEMIVLYSASEDSIPKDKISAFGEVSGPIKDFIDGIIDDLIKERNGKHN